MKHFSWAMIGILFSCMATAAVDYIRYVDADYEDVLDELRNAIIERGLAIEHEGNVGAMLERTASVNVQDSSADQGSPYLHARYIQFCSSMLTHKATRANAQNISMCPFLVFIYETQHEPGRIAIGYRPPTLSSDKQSQLLHEQVTHYLSELLDEVADDY